jgi:hypothetical protein
MATLSWTIPTTRANGSPLSAADLAGYEIYMLQEGTGATRSISITNPLSTGHTIRELAPDNYHFSMIALDTSGNRSTLSSIVMKSIR